ncbi:MAG: O-antigen ligase family protein, partial [Phormidesmis sp.]
HQLPSQWPSQWIGASGFLLLMIFTWLPGSYTLMAGWPYVLVWQGAFFILSIYLFRLCRQFTIPMTRLGHGLDAPIALIVLAMTLSTVMAQFKAVAGWNLLLVIHYIICLYFLVNWMRAGKLTQMNLWGIVAVTGTVTSLISIAMWRPNPRMWLSQDFNDAIRNANPLGHHNFVGGYALLLLPLVFGFALSKKRWARWGLFFAAGITALAVYASGSRGALLGFLSLIAVTVGAGVWVSKGRSRQRWLMAGVLLFLLASLAFVSNPRTRTMLSTTPSAIDERVSVSSLQDGPVKDRLFMLSTASNILKEHPILGIGPGNLSRVYNLYRPIEAGTGLNLVQQLHNTPAQILAELGGLGFLSYVVLLSVLVRLCLVIYRSFVDSRPVDSRSVDTLSVDSLPADSLPGDSPTGDAERLLLFSLCASWFGYGVSSFTDYQLENVGISSTLIATAALLVGLADAQIKDPTKDPTKTESRFTLSNKLRRVVSLCLLAFLCVSLQLWARVDLGFYMAYRAVQDTAIKDFVAADDKLLKASTIVAWDPTYAALAAEGVIALSKTTSAERDRTELNAIAADYMQAAVTAAPNDPWFNQNSAVLLLDKDPALAENYAKQAVRLFPRSPHSYTYYTLGVTYLEQGKTQAAAHAFALEALANPQFLTSDVWERESFLPIKEQVIDETLNSYRQVLSQTQENSIQYQWLKEQIAIISWWYGKSVDPQTLDDLRPLVHALLISDDNPQKSVELVEQHILEKGQEQDDSADIQLLLARLDPEKNLTQILAELDGTPEEEATLTESLLSDQSTRLWFRDVVGKDSGQIRFGTAFAYRNLAANAMRLILYPGDVNIAVLPSSIGFFAVPPREYPQLDGHMRKLRGENLGI